MTTTAGAPDERGVDWRPLDVGRAARAALLAVPLLVLLVQAWVHRWITDDGFIDLRVVQQIVAGHGPVFNAGQRVETFTSPLWVAILTIADVVTPIRLEWLAVGLGIAATVAGLALAMAGSGAIARRVDGGGWLVPAGAIVPLAVLPFWYFASSGLETGLVFGWQGASLWILARWAVRGRRLAWWEAAVLGLGWLVRPELVLFSVVFLVAVLVGDRRVRGWTGRVTFAAWMFALPVAYEVFRMGYFGLVVPNTALAKEASSAWWSRGWDYLTSSFGPYWLWIPAAALVAGGYVPLVRTLRAAREERALLTVGAFVAGAVLDAAYIVRVGGDYIHARLLLPSLFALAAPVAVVVLRKRTAVTLAVVPWAFVAAIGLRSNAVPFVLPNLTRAVTTTDFGWGPHSARRAVYDAAAVTYNGRPVPVMPRAGLPLPTGASWGIGVSSYAIGPRLNVLDMLGLADVLDAHFELHRRGYPGHEKPMPPAWAVALLVEPGTPVHVRDFPQPLLVVPLEPWPRDDAELARQVAWARAALRCPAIRDLRARSTGTLTVSRFFSNITHSLADSRLRIPPDPEQAYRKFCGPGFPSGTR